MQILLEAYFWTSQESVGKKDKYKKNTLALILLYM